MLRRWFKQFRKKKSSKPIENSPITISETRPDDDMLEKYDLSKKAYVLVLHHYEYKDPNDNRNGSQIDMAKIQTFFSFYRTDPERLNIRKNLPLQKVRGLMDKMQKRDFSAHSCVIVIIMSHGGDGDTILAQDGGLYFLNEDVVAKVASNPTLDGKPKIFIVNACRGNLPVTDSPKKTSSQQLDTVIFQSTYEGHVSYRNTRTGSFFVDKFFDLLREYDHLNICVLNRFMNHCASQERYVQNPTMTATLRKQIIIRDLRK